MTSSLHDLRRDLRTSGFKAYLDANGRLHVKGGMPPPDLRRRVATSAGQLRNYLRFRTRIQRLEAPRIRWAHPPWTGDFYAWAEGAEREPIPVGLERIAL